MGGGFGNGTGAWIGREGAATTRVGANCAFAGAITTIGKAMKLAAATEGGGCVITTAGAAITGEGANCPFAGAITSIGAATTGGGGAICLAGAITIAGARAETCGMRSGPGGGSRGGIVNEGGGAGGIPATVGPRAAVLGAACSTFLRIGSVTAGAGVNGGEAEKGAIPGRGRGSEGEVTTGAATGRRGAAGGLGEVIGPGGSGAGRKRGAGAGEKLPSVSSMSGTAIIGANAL